MKKIILFGATFAAVLGAQSVTAHAVTYTETAVSSSGGSSASIDVTQYVSSESGATIVVDAQAVPPLPPLPPMGAPNRMQIPLERETNRQLIERMRMQRENRVLQIHQSGQTTGATGSMRIYREVDGNVIKDRTIPLAASSGRRIGTMFLGMPATSGPRGYSVRAVAASSSRASFLRNGMNASGTFETPLPHGFGPGSLMWQSSGTPMMGYSTPGGNALFFTNRKPPFEAFFERVRGLFQNRPSAQVQLIETIQ